MNPKASPAQPDTDQRLDKARRWLVDQGVELQSGFFNVAGDASFRRYFRIEADGVSRVLMDAPPPNEDVRPFIDIARRLEASGLHSPGILHANPHEGFLLLEDLGDELYRDILDAGNATVYFPGLFRILRQFALSVNTDQLPRYSAELLRQDMDLFPNWYLDRHRPSVSRQHFDHLWEGFCDAIISSALAQPQCFVHRDFHSCNLIRKPSGEIGVIDFQDGVLGPISYDLVSLLWDRYIQWPREKVEAWIEQFRVDLGLETNASDWLRYCDLMGLQRNIKIVGIFARLYYRDGKQAYLELIPRFYEYVTDVLSRYPEFAGMLELMEDQECAP